MDSMFVAMVIFAFVGAVTPGPVNLLATSTAAQYGRYAATLHVIGASIAYAVVVFITGNTLNGIVEWLPKIELVMKLIGSAFLCYLSYKIYTAPYGELELKDGSLSSWSNGALVQLINPKAWLVAMSGVSLYVVGQNEQQAWLWTYTLVSLVACLIGVGLWAVIGTLFTTHLDNPKTQLLFNRVMASILFVSVLMIWI